MTDPTSRLERRYRLLLRCYPARWRRHHEEEVVAVLLQQAEASNRSTVGPGAVVDLVGHGAEERLESALRWIPDQLRTRIAICAVVAGAALGLLMLVGEMIGARHRPPADEIHSYGHSFLSGPFLTIGIGLYLAFMTAALLVVRGRGGLARVLVIAAVAYTAWMRSFWSGPYPTPELLVLALFAGLGMLAALATIRPSRRTARGMIGYGAALLTALVLAVLATRPVLDWSIGTMTTSGNVAFSVLATALPLTGGVALLVAALGSRRRPGWPAAIAVTALPAVVFCTIASQLVNPVLAAERAWFPVYYLLAVTTVALVHRRLRQRRPLTTS